jgi:putative tryptophan/tyrosine transport system substrate-binding protein
MKRRQFITLLGGAALWPLGARGQQPDRVRRIGYLVFTSAPLHSKYSQAFRTGLRDLGYVERKNIVIEFRFAEGNDDRVSHLAGELVRLNVDVLVTYGPAVPAVQRATSTIPIVMATYGDAVATGLIASLANPGGNLTGLTFFNPELMAKRLELLKEIVPSMTTAGVVAT